jgi:hypothetical protein
MLLFTLQVNGRHLCTIPPHPMRHSWPTPLCEQGRPLYAASCASLPANGLCGHPAQHQRPTSLRNAWAACVHQSTLCGASGRASFDEGLCPTGRCSVRGKEGVPVLLGWCTTLQGGTGGRPGYVCEGMKPRCLEVALEGAKRPGVHVRCRCQGV